MPITISSSIYDFSDYLNSEVLINKRFEAGLSTAIRSCDLGNCTINEVLDFVRSEALGNYPTLLVADTGDSDSVSHIIAKDCWVSVTKSGEMISVEVKGEEELVKEVNEKVKNKFPQNPVFVRWVIKTDGDSVKLPVDDSFVPRSIFYPQLGDESLNSYYDRFINSKANVLVLYGPPGTGKTSFIKGLLLHARMNALISYDPAILERDSIFASFLSGRENIMILEDADSFLGSRSKGNTVMHRFLNVGDGLISTKKKKIIFSTNLPTVKDIDSALLRPGRCFDVMEFRNLSPAEAGAINPGWTGNEPVSLATLLNNCNRSEKAIRRIGF